MGHIVYGYASYCTLFSYIKIHFNIVYCDASYLSDNCTFPRLLLIIQKESYKWYIHRQALHHVVLYCINKKNGRLCYASYCTLFSYIKKKHFNNVYCYASYLSGVILYFISLFAYFAYN